VDRCFALHDPTLNIPLRVLPRVSMHDINVLDNGSAAGWKHSEYPADFAFVATYQNLNLILFLYMKHFIS
jgi:hypothetical protein